MSAESSQHSAVSRRTTLTWLVVAVLFLLCGVLGYLQYIWIGEVSAAARDRMRSSLQANLVRLRQDFNTEVTGAARALLPADPGELPQAEGDIEARYRQWRQAGRHGRVFRAIAIAKPRDGTLTLRALNLEKGIFADAQWPAEWQPVKERLELRLSRAWWQNRGPGAGPGRFGMAAEGDGLVFEVPLALAAMAGTGPPGMGGGDRPRWRAALPPPQGPAGEPRPERPVAPPMAEAGWMILDLNSKYVGETMLPELLHRHLGSGGALDYDVAVFTRTNPPVLIYRTGSDDAKHLAATADASVNLFGVDMFQLFRGAAPPARERAGVPGGPGPRAEFGRWEMFVRHRAGSLEAVVSQTRWRNLAVTGGVLLLMIASVAALIRFTRRAQRLAEMEMDFVAGVSHELRTPLTVIHTAAYNLRGSVAQNPGQVEKYGTLIQQESARLKDLVEQVLRFAGAKAGRVVQKFEPVSVEAVIEASLQSSEALIQASRCRVETEIEPGLPPVAGDPIALKHALQNLISNAAKYGAEGGDWIGVFARAQGDNGQAEVEIRVADRGPGIPEDEQAHVFDPFFRGRRAMEDQVHGTGLGLNLAKKIVEAHGGSIALKSEAGKGTEFVIRIPAAPAGQKHEFANSTGRG